MTRSNGEALRTGTTLSRYRIIERIGAGGMGEVYRARDLDLDRDVAIKVLPSGFTGNEDRVRRFVREAKAASALNHPNIVVIYEIGSADVSGAKISFMAMELIEGETLHERILDPHRDLRALIAQAAQAAEALSKAHAAGIIHRDLKPDNLMITRDGYAKVLDFGVAKLAERTEEITEDEARDTDIRLTNAGVVLGTIGYMSPEQVEGRTVDARSDIFSFGCILYEIATGQRAFRGRTQDDILRAIIQDDPIPVETLNPAAPAGLGDIIYRCLEKEPDDRFQSMREVADALRRIVAVSGEAPVVRIESSRAVWPRLAIAAAILIIAAVVLYFLRGDARVSGRDAVQMTIIPVNAQGQAVSCAPSPDGRYLAYTTYHRGLSGIRVRQLATNSEIQVRPPTRDTYYEAVQYSPDGDHLYVLEYPGDSGVGVLSRVAAIGGEPREVLRNVDSRPSFSPDGKSIAFVRHPTASESLLVIASAEGTGLRTVASQRAPARFVHSTWSPDGEWIAAIVRSLTTRDELLQMISADGTERRPVLANGWPRIETAEWMPDMKSLLVVGTPTISTHSQIWSVSLTDGHVARITNDLHDYTGLGRTADGTSAYTIQTAWHARIWSLDPGSGALDAVTDEQFAHIPMEFELLDEERLLFHSSQAGDLDVWMLERDGAEMQQLTRDAASEFFPLVSQQPGVIYYQRSSGATRDLWTMNPRGGQQRRVASLPPNTSNIDISPDGRWVVAATPDGLTRISTADGSRKVLVPGRTSRVSYSHDGRLIAASVHAASGERRTLILDPDGVTVGEFPLKADELYRIMEWTADSRHLVVVVYSQGADNLHLLPIDGGPMKQITRFTSDAIGEVKASPRNQTLYFSRGTSRGNCVRLSNF